jgi:hypothetical protein
MHKSRVLGLSLLVVTGLFFSCASAMGDDNAVPSFEAVHALLQQAADAYKADTPPVPAQQVELLNKAAKMLGQIPRGGYHGQLKAAIRSVEAAIDEINTGDTAHKAKEDIYDADDAVKSIMSS